MHVLMCGCVKKTVKKSNKLSRVSKFKAHLREKVGVNIKKLRNGRVVKDQQGMIKR